MGHIKKLIYRILFFFLDIKFKISVRCFLWVNKKAKAVYFVDIDNTIADTWPSLLKKWPSEAKRFISIPSFEGMKKCLHEIYADKRNIIIYISVRNFRYYNLTINWLSVHGFPVKETMLVLTALPKQKLQYLNIPGSRFTVTFIDDLAYDHEKGLVKKYDEVIAAVKELPVTYIGSDDIDKINSLKS